MSDYEVTYTGALLVESLLFEARDFNKIEFLGDTNFYAVQGDGKCSINVRTREPNFDLEADLNDIRHGIYEKDPDAKVKGKIYWKGQADEDFGYIEVKDNSQETFVGVYLYVPEEDYEAVMKVIDNYMGSDMKEFIRQGVKDED